METHNLRGQPVPVLCHLHSGKVFPDVQNEWPVFESVPVDSGSVTGHAWKESRSVFFAPFHQIFIHIDEIPPEPSLLQVEQFQFFQPRLIGDML